MSFENFCDSGLVSVLLNFEELNSFAFSRTNESAEGVEELFWKLFFAAY